MNSPEHLIPAQNNQVVTVDAIFIAQQFERINTTLEFFGKSIDAFTIKEKEQDNKIAGIRSDITEIKGDIRALKDESARATAKKIPWTAVGAFVVAIVSVLMTILDRMYGG